MNVCVPTDCIFQLLKPFYPFKQTNKRGPQSLWRLSRPEITSKPKWPSLGRVKWVNTFSFSDKRFGTDLNYTHFAFFGKICLALCYYNVSSFDVQQSFSIYFSKPELCLFPLPKYLNLLHIWPGLKCQETCTFLQCRIETCSISLQLYLRMLKCLWNDSFLSAPHHQILIKQFGCWFVCTPMHFLKLTAIWPPRYLHSVVS